MAGCDMTRRDGPCSASHEIRPFEESDGIRYIGTLGMAREIFPATLLASVHFRSDSPHSPTASTLDPDRAFPACRDWHPEGGSQRRGSPRRRFRARCAEETWNGGAVVEAGIVWRSAHGFTTLRGRRGVPQLRWHEVFVQGYSDGLAIMRLGWLWRQQVAVQLYSCLSKVGGRACLAAEQRWGTHISGEHRWQLRHMLCSHIRCLQGPSFAEVVGRDSLRAVCLVLLM